MIGSIFVALSGMTGHQRALNVISNNVANMNTPGFRGSTVNFADVFGGGQAQVGAGVDASKIVRDARAGDPQLTGNPTDLALDGEGFFVLQNEDGEIFYSRNGRFLFNNDNELVTAGQGLKVMTRNAAGQLVPLAFGNLRSKPAKATTEITLDGLLSSTVEETTLDVSVLDALGNSHPVKLTLRKDTSGQPPLPTGQTAFTVKASEEDVEIGTGTLTFHGQAAFGVSVSLELALHGTDAATVSFDYLGVQMTSNPVSQLRVSRQDGLTSGAVTDKTFDARGVLQLTYSNGQKAEGPALILAQIPDESGLLEVGASLFSYRGDKSVALRAADNDLQVVPKSLELSNVDLTTEFSQLILMQRGYQASSQVVSTANDMLQELLQMRGRG